MTKIQPFGCDVRKASDEERREFLRLLTKDSEIRFAGICQYYVWSINDIPDNAEGKEDAMKTFTQIIPISEGISMLKKALGEEEKEEDVSIFIISIRSNFELWKKDKITDGAFSFHLNNNLIHIEKILTPKP